MARGNSRVPRSSLHDERKTLESQRKTLKITRKIIELHLKRLELHFKRLKLNPAGTAASAGPAAAAMETLGPTAGNTVGSRTTFKPYNV